MAVTLAVPVLPLHNVLVLDVEAVTCAGCVMLTVWVPLQPLASVIVTVYVPALSPVACWLVCALFQLYV